MELNAVMFANRCRRLGSVVLIKVWAKIFKNRSLILRFHHPYLVLQMNNLFSQSSSSSYWNQWVSELLEVEPLIQESQGWVRSQIFISSCLKIWGWDCVCSKISIHFNGTRIFSLICFWKSQIVLRATSRNELCKSFPLNRSLRSSQRYQEFYRVTTAILDFFLHGLVMHVSAFVAFVFLCSEHYYTHWSKWQFSPVGRHAWDQYCAYNKMGKCSTLQRLSLPRSTASKTAVSRALWGAGNEVCMASECNPVFSHYYHWTPLWKAFLSYHRREEGFSTAEGQEEGDAGPRAGLCPLLSLFSLCSQESPPSRSPPRAAAGSQTTLRSRHVLDT